MAYVDTEKIKKALNNFSHIGTGDVRYDCGYDDCMTAVEDTISDLPTADVVEVETLKAWLYEIAINNVGCVLDGDFSDACQEIISRLYGLRKFAQERK